ncbi:NADH pyrophosphatase [Geotalea daltonii FRC-32]|uniref:NAD(+) diphosphatase n=1 Tax=Geotalea daltonii (strain DSM 22248 / JCM 15807 / FRC-32) TaxID=316067 RepID=B9M821_GEODF|nr:NAD(+) diphosphatase [Geotalea daltonii]ACM20287.1 NADH pyrophosphatase [Geotalea daltonii FRC-32]
MKYPSAVNLPFNGEIIKDRFTLARPGEGRGDGPGYWIIIQGNAMVVKEEQGAISLHEGTLPSWLEAKSEPLCFGYWQNSPIYGVVVGKNQILPAPYVAEPFNAAEDDRLDDSFLTLGGLALQTLHWERNSAVCSRCGGSLQRIENTWGKRCQSCAYEHFPHISPCVIVLVKRGDQFLLGRKSVWPEGRYSLIAGFLDFGESLEECVHREVMEEAGVEVENLHYVGSQNWPFPSQLMAGFVADYAGGEINIDGEELEDVRWFSRDAMPPSLPAKRSIARWIIDSYT